MFEQIINSIPEGFEPESFSIIQEKWKAKHEASNMHQTVCVAECELPNVHGFEWDRFSRNNLKDVWASNCSFTTKYLSTLWWGRVYPLIFNRVFSDENLNRLQQVAPALERTLVNASSLDNYNDFQKTIREIVSNMQSGVFRIPFVGVAFFTKVLQFYFAAHPVSSRNGFLPIIADRWIMRAVYNEMTDCSDIELRDSVFALNHGNVFLKKRQAGDISKSYILYIDYFNRRCENLNISPWDMESYLFKNQAVITRFRQLVQQVDNHPINEIRLRVYNTIGKNYGKTLLIVNNKKTLPHQTDEVFVSFRDTLYEARIGSYRKGNTLRGKDTIKHLIENNRWQPGQEFIASFLLTEEGWHVFKIES